MNLTSLFKVFLSPLAIDSSYMKVPADLSAEIDGISNFIRKCKMHKIEQFCKQSKLEDFHFPDSEFNLKLLLPEQRGTNIKIDI